MESFGYHSGPLTEAVRITSSGSSHSWPIMPAAIHRREDSRMMFPLAASATVGSTSRAARHSLVDQGGTVARRLWATWLRKCHGCWSLASCLAPVTSNVIAFGEVMDGEICHIMAWLRWELTARPAVMLLVQCRNWHWAGPAIRVLIIWALSGPAAASHWGQTTGQTHI